jgi:hypothetical protein
MDYMINWQQQQQQQQQYTQDPYYYSYNQYQYPLAVPAAAPVYYDNNDAQALKYYDVADNYLLRSYSRKYSRTYNNYSPLFGDNYYADYAPVAKGFAVYMFAGFVFTNKALFNFS